MYECNQKDENCSDRAYLNKYTSLDILKMCNEILESLLGRDNNNYILNKWWLSPNKAFDMHTPWSVFIKDPKKVYNYLLNYLDK